MAKKKNLPLSKMPKLLWELHNKMVLIRRFEESTIKSYQQKKIGGFLHAYIGQEAVGVGVLAHKKPEDSVVTSYRCHGLGLALGISPEACMAEVFGKVTGIVRGKGGSMHFFDKERNLLGGHGIVGGQFGIGIGAAFASNYKKQNAVSFIFFGEGAVPQGTFHENMNMASLMNLPVVFICEDNKYAMGTENVRILANTSISEAAAFYKIKGYAMDGMNLSEIHDQMGDIVEEVRKTKRPALIHLKTYRYKGHSVSDAAKYRTKEEEEKWKEDDPLFKSADLLVSEGYKTREEVEAEDKKTKDYIKEIVKLAESSPDPPLEELTQHVYFDKREGERWQ